MHALVRGHLGTHDMYAEHLTSKTFLYCTICTRMYILIWLVFQQLLFEF